MNTFAHGVTTVSIARPPERPFTVDGNLAQLDGLDSGGSTYVYTRGPVAHRRSLIFPRVTSAELAALNSFFAATVAGYRQQFTWTDDSSVDHTVRYVQHTWRRTHPAWFRVELALDDIW